MYSYKSTWFKSKKKERNKKRKKIKKEKEVRVFTDKIIPPLFRVRRRQRRLDLVPRRVVDQDMGMSVRSVDLVEQGADLGRVREIGRDGEGLHVRAELAQLGGDLVEALAVPGDEDDGFGTGFGEGRGESLFGWSMSVPSPLTYRALDRW